MKLIRTLITTFITMFLLLNVVHAELNSALEVKAEKKESVTQTTDKYDGIDINVNINSASAQEIASMLKGIGIKKAQDIVDYRNEHGNFQSIDELTKVKGIGPATIKNNRDRIIL